MNYYLALPPWVWALAITLVCGAAAWKGGRSERLAAVTLFTGWLASLAVVNTRGWPLHVGLWTVDLILLAVLVGIALRSHRYWPIFVAGFHLLTVLTHVARAVDRQAGAWAQATAGVMFSYLMLAALAFGAWGAWRERRQLANAGLRVIPDPTRR